ncbi:MAG: hypothetical protein A2201_11750 [Alicyclobacillus sp. RIFOXYA1_FULL_53_8]|nr:MAG: hypothetical protein A2201_11750 [Alicyclobacillus sp. RIFOXYA1_FULL_53_8]
MMSIAYMTWIEILRKRVLLVTTVLTMAFLGLYMYAVHAMASSLAVAPPGAVDLLNHFIHGALFLAIGLYTANFTVAYLNIFSAAGTISAEIESGLLLAILPRPISRWKVYLGKFIGYGAWGLLYGAVMFWSVVLIVHMNVDFPMDATTLVKGFLMFELIPLVLVSLSMIASLYLPTLGAGVAVTLLFGLGLIGGFIQRVNLTSSAQAALDNVGLITSLIMPANPLYYRMVYELMGGSNFSLSGGQTNNMLGPFCGGSVPSNAFVVYSIVYICAALLWGAYQFTRKDI